MRSGRRASYLKSRGLRARDVMTSNVITVTEDASMEQIATLLEQHRIKRVPVLRDGRLVGVVSRANLLQGLAAARVAESAFADDTALREAIQAELLKTGPRAGFLNVVVSERVAHLWGAVFSEAQRRAVRLAAERTPGVARVEDHLTIVPPNVRTGMWAS